MSVYVITKTRADGERMVLCDYATKARAELWQVWRHDSAIDLPLSALVYATASAATRAARRSSESHVVVEVEDW